MVIKNVIICKFCIYLLVGCWPSSSSEFEVKVNDSDVTILADENIIVKVTKRSNVTGIVVEKDGLIISRQDFLSGASHAHNVTQRVSREGEEWLISYKDDGTIGAEMKFEPW